MLIYNNNNWSQALNDFMSVINHVAERLHNGNVEIKSDNFSENEIRKAIKAAIVDAAHKVSEERRTTYATIARNITESMDIMSMKELTKMFTDFIKDKNNNLVERIQKHVMNSTKSNYLTSTEINSEINKIKDMLDS